MTKIIYFGMISEAVGCREEQFELTGNTIRDLNEMLKNKYEKLKDLNYTFALNQTLVGEKEVISDNSEIALLPPFAGG